MLGELLSIDKELIEFLSTNARPLVGEPLTKARRVFFNIWRIFDAPSSSYAKLFKPVGVNIVTIS